MKNVGEDEYLCLSVKIYRLSSDIVAKLFDESQTKENHREEDFEFSLVLENLDKSIVEFICEGQTKFQQSIFPLFNRDLSLKEIKKIPAGTYCMSKSEISEPLPGECKKKINRFCHEAMAVDSRSVTAE
ncbi:hypothetical protein EJD97_022066 [Solanum chilense]|uniref:Uncharacterized protein n=1 Tax=Solanum chilense TaxID=4083 RepID=A0A6N2AD86_SOLCI|nr:hypothetical protein EJD97_022066 [Solanum chilense]